MFWGESRRKPIGLGDLLYPFAEIAPGVLLQKDGSLLIGWRYRGPDMDSKTADELDALSQRLNAALRLGARWMLNCDLIRSAAPGYPDEGSFPDPVSRVIDHERRQQFTLAGAHFESEYFLTLTYLPPRQTGERLWGFFFEGHGDNRAAQNALDYFRITVERFENVFCSLFRAEPLLPWRNEAGVVFDPLLRYLHRTITGDNHPFARPVVGVDLNDLLATQDFYGGIDPRIGSQHIGVLAIDGFPLYSQPGILRAVDELGIPYRWSTRAIFLDPLQAQAMIKVHRKKWTGKTRGAAETAGLPVRSSGAADDIDDHAVDMTIDARAARKLAAAGDVHFLQYTSAFLCLHRDPNVLSDNLRMVSKAIQNLGFGVRRETVNAVEAYLGSIPGNGYANVRRPLIHTLNLADMLPTSAIYAGESENPSRLMPKHSPPLLITATSGATPFNVNLHVDDVGHSMIAGPTGSGKSIFLGLTAVQWLRYKDARVYIFDRGYSSWFVTKAVGGDFYDLAADASLSFCPLAGIQDSTDVTWAVEWIEALCALNGLIFTAEHRNAVAEAVGKLRLSPSPTLTELAANVQDLEIRAALACFLIGDNSGSVGRLLDADHDALLDGRFVTFEMESLLQLGDKAVIPVLLYLFRRIEKSLTGEPTLIILDEAWSYLQQPLFCERLKEWLKTMRRKNCVVVMATQQISDVANSTNADVILESCPTKILLPNAEAASSGSRKFYDCLGLNGREIETIKYGIPKRDYYITSKLGKRRVDLQLQGVALAWLSVSGRKEREEAQRLMDELPDTWRVEWLRRRGLTAWADHYETLEGARKETECVKH